MSGRLHDLEYRVLIDHLADIRRRVGMTQTELARRLARPQSYISKIERFERRLDVGEWRRMAIALDQSPTQAFSEVDSLLDDMDALAQAPAPAVQGPASAGEQASPSKRSRRRI